ncbi:hypothetical protein F5984_05715 [Rudanella paleaurantiibacter]|uniref:Integral membrane protein YccS N-terminal domain-containing protein n=1 Tax=Rudanella paleaurantiibacter TaxID=2614655 RepID=A0A7J5U2B1_9BACT|nr:FUSC family membrane protein [Rudanella paleaurantiibacter]KAB7731722.1 hypothetical protein F5984_05715 [Rudanella paleaurantiibacter]
MQPILRSVRYFLSSHYFSDGLRTTVAVLLPALFFFQVQKQPDIGLLIGLGALSASITDMPGPLVHKRNGLLACCLTIFLTAILTGFARLNGWTLGLEIGLLSFFFALFNVYGNRAAAVGSAGMLTLILTMARGANTGATGSQTIALSEILTQATLILLGGLWYTGISLVFRQFRPYRQAQQALAECIHEIARFLRIKADFYDGRTDLDDDYRRLVAQHVVVSEKQDVVRELLFKSRQVVAETTSTGRVLVLTFAEVVDLYEQISAMYYDYQSLRDRFGATGILNLIATQIHRLVNELDAIGLAILEGSAHRPRLDMHAALEQIQAAINALPPNTDMGNPLVLRRVLVSIRQLAERINGLLQIAPETGTTPADPSTLDYSRFVSHQPIDVARLRDNLSLRSSVFRYSLRMAIACVVGYIVATFWPNGHHSYWILLTITVILKPAYSLTRQRNSDRLLGTLAGGLLGVVILAFVPNPIAQFVFMVLFMLGTYSFQRRNYITMVICVTPFVLILFNFMGIGFREVVGERMLDTLIGGVIAVIASYGLLPRWESEQVLPVLRDVLNADIKYLQKLEESLCGRVVTETDYKLARKSVYVQSANLSAAFERMLSEPKSKRRHQQDLLQFAVLNHIFSSNVATIVLTTVDREHTPATDTLLRPVRRSLDHLAEALNRLDRTDKNPELVTTPALPSTSPATDSPDDQLLAEQLAFVQKLTADMAKVAATIQG